MVVGGIIVNVVVVVFYSKAYIAYTVFSRFQRSFFYQKILNSKIDGTIFGKVNI